jgi:endonuclease YncB( thermonuclease family)
MPKKKIHSVPTWKKVLAAAAASATLGTSALALKNLPYYIGEKVVEVVDGDTFIIANRQPIRLYGLNAPELSYCLGPEAKRALSTLVLGKRVFVREPLSDGNGRVMALVYVDNTLVNAALIQAGLAAYHRQGGSETPALKTASDYARAHNLGIFSPQCYQIQPPDPKCAIKANDDERTGKKLYFTPSCNYYSLVAVQKYRGDRWFCTEKAAQAAGFTKSSDCKNR